MARELINYSPLSVNAPLDIFFPGEKLPGRDYSHGLYRGEIQVDGVYKTHIITKDFPPSDPWSKFFRSNIELLKEAGWFSGQPVMELGIGDGRNIRIIGGRIPCIIGVDVVAEKLDACQANIKNEDHTALELYNMRAEDFLSLWDMRERGKFSGRVIMCLPQSRKNFSQIFQTATAADVYREPIANHILHVLFSRWEKYGLTLNATVLERLRKIVSDDTEILMILSDRIMPDVREQMITEKGWKIAEKATSRVKQDWDTKLDWMKGLSDDGKRFYNSRGVPLPSSVAIGLVKQADSAKELDVYHDVTVYRLTS